MEEINLCSHEQCTGCMACVQVCTRSAISKQIEKGFYYPAIDEEKCVKCGLCMKVCPVLNLSGSKGNCHVNEKTCYAAYSLDENVRMNSSSGGVFSVLAQKVLSDGGFVYGAAWDENMNLRHICINNVVDLDKIRRSKYVQSDTLNTFVEVREHLRNGEKVLFCGTPCQIAGLNNFLLGKNCENLLLVDILCQGVPSPILFQKYIKEVENEENFKIKDCNFRPKKYGWRCGLLMIVCGVRKGEYRTLKLYSTDNAYYRAFMFKYFHRPSCYNCIFKNSNRGYYSDVTIADFWRIGTNIPLNVSGTEKGISALIVNTEKGKSYVNDISNEMLMIERSYQEFSTNGGLRSIRIPQNNDEVFFFLQTHSWRETQDKYFPVSVSERIKTCLKIYLGDRTINTIKRIVK